MGGEAAELAVVVAQAVGHSMALVVALRGLGAEAVYQFLTYVLAIE